MKSVSCALMVLVYGLLSSACADDGEVLPDSRVSPATFTQPASAISDRPTRTPISEEQLVSELIAIELPAASDSSDHSIVFEEGKAKTGFYSYESRDEIVDFFASELTSHGWTPEGDLFDDSIALSSDAAINAVLWSFTKDDKRLLLGAQLNPVGAPSGRATWGITIQPDWFSLPNGSPAPTRDQ